MEFDLLIRGGNVVDGSGSVPAFPADVGVTDGRITAVGSLAGATAARVVDATGLVVAPGFVDVHIHSETNLLRSDRRRYGALFQGVTTHLLAPDGFGWAPLPPDRARELWQGLRFAYGESDLSFNWPTPEAYLAEFAGRTPANVVPQVPHCAVRMAVMGWAGRPATEAELAQMRTHTRAWMEAGAVALNLGLDYQPSAFADYSELVELCKVVREYGGIYAAHVRYRGLGRPGAWRETIDLGLQAEIPVHISHEHVTDETEPLLDEAAARGCDLSFESYMYLAGCTHLAMMLPIWAQEGGPEGIRRRLTDPDSRRRIREHLDFTLNEGVAQGARPVFAATQSGRYIGLSVHQAADRAGMAVADLGLRLLEEEHPFALMVYHRAGTPEEHLQTIRRTARHPRMMVASDGIYHGPHGHPRGFGCFARVLRLCVRELQELSLEQAVYRMSGYPAERFRLKDRGLLRRGYGADLVLFDPATVADRSTWDEPWLEPVGIKAVFVNGRPVVVDGEPTGELPGQVLRRR